MATDLGKPTALVAHQLRQCAAVVLEFNHDEELLWGGPYPWPLKKRIAGPHGHLSNAQAARLLQDGLGETLAHLVLGHLSEHNNTPTHALAAAMAVLGTADALAPVGGTTPRVTVTVAPPRSPAPPVRVRAEAW